MCHSMQGLCLPVPARALAVICAVTVGNNFRDGAIARPHDNCICWKRYIRSVDEFVGCGWGPPQVTGLSVHATRGTTADDA